MTQSITKTTISHVTPEEMLGPLIGNNMQLVNVIHERAQMLGKQQQLDIPDTPVDWFVRYDKLMRDKLVDLRLVELSQQLRIHPNPTKNELKAVQQKIDAQICSALNKDNAELLAKLHDPAYIDQHARDIVTFYSCMRDIDNTNKQPDNPGVDKVVDVKVAKKISSPPFKSTTQPATRR